MRKGDGLKAIPKFRLDTTAIALKAERANFYCIESEVIKNAVYVRDGNEIMLTTHKNGYLVADIDKMKKLADEIAEIISVLPSAYGREENVI